MKTSLKAVAVAAVLVTAWGATSAQSATLASLGSSVQGPGNTAHLYAGAYGAVTPTSWTWSTDPTVVVPPDFVSGQYRSPFQNTPLGNTRNFFSVGSPAGNGSTTGAISPVELSFGGTIDSLKILWGSIDDYNFLEFFNGATSLGVISGAMIKALIGNPGVESVALVNITDIGGATRAVFTSDTAAFEIGFVPIPAALPLFGTALGGLLLLRSRRKHTSAATLPA